MIHWQRDFRNGLRSWHRSILWYFHPSKSKIENTFRKYMLTVWFLCPTALGMAYLFSKRMY